MGRYSVDIFFGEARIYVCNYLIAYIPSHTIRIWYYRYIMKFTIADGASVLIGCKFSCAKHFKLGKNSTINQNCHLDNRIGLNVKDNVSIAARCAFITADHLIDSPKFEGRERGITIENYVFIGFGAIILGGITLGKGSVVGAGSLVTKDTEDYSVNVGTPSRKIKERNQDLRYTTNYRRLFH